MIHAQEKLSVTVADAVAQGLSRQPKKLPSWLFYDATGDQIFQQIMKLPEYYLTAAERDILTLHGQEMVRAFASRELDLIELGAGDGSKTEVILDQLRAAGCDVTYRPVDISPAVLGQLQQRLLGVFPALKVHPVVRQYHEALALPLPPAAKRVFLFLGANIGNFEWPEAIAFLRALARVMRPSDDALVGFDLKKDPDIIRLAYDDRQGVTRGFNLNLLRRLNRELGANFDEQAFSHRATYDAATGRAESFLVSRVRQVVQVKALDRSFSFEAGETIHTEVSLKYDQAMLEQVAREARLTIRHVWKDARHYFCNVLFQPAHQNDSAAEK